MILLLIPNQNNSYDLVTVDHVLYDKDNAHVIQRDIPADVLSPVLHRLLQSLTPYTVEGLHNATAIDNR